MELPVAITLLLGSIPNSVHFQLQSRVKVEFCASLLNKGFQISCKMYTEGKVLLTEVSCEMYASWESYHQHKLAAVIQLHKLLDHGITYYNGYR